MQWPAACLFFSGLLAIAAAATVDADTVRRAADCRILRLNVFAPRAPRLSGWLTDTGDGIVILSRSNPAAYRARPVFVYPVPRPDAPCAAATANTSGVVAVLHQWSTSVFDPVNDHVLAVAATGSGSGLLLLTVAVVPAAATNTSGGAALDWQSFVLSDGLYGRDERDSHGGLGGLGVRSTAAPEDGGEAEQQQRHRSGTRRPRAAAAAAAAPPPLLLANSLTYAGQRGRWVALPRDETSFSVAWYDGLSPIVESYLPIDIVYDVARCS